MESLASVDVRRPIAEVFTYTTENVAEWSRIVVEDEVIEDVNNGGVGTTFRSVTEDRGQRMEFHGTVVKHEPPTLLAVRLIGKQFDIDAVYTFEDLGDATRVAQLSKVDGKGFVKVIFALFGWAMKKSGCKAAENELLNLKSILEARSE